MVKKSPASEGEETTKHSVGNERKVSTISELLAKETLDRLNSTRTVEFKYYWVGIPGVVAIVVVPSKNRNTRKEQDKELRNLGYAPISEVLKTECLACSRDETMYAIKTEKLRRIHSI